MKKKLLAMLLAVVLAAGLLPGTAWASAFSDVPSGAWYAAAVGWAVDSGITMGTGDGRFSPERTCTEGEILTMLYRAAGSPPVEASPAKATFWYADAVNWAYWNGMIGWNFDYNAPCTRASTVYYIWRAFGSPDSIVTGFSDVPANYAAAVYWAAENGITAGTGGTQFSPDRTCMREEIVTFLHRAYVPGARLPMD